MPNYWFSVYNLINALTHHAILYQKIQFASLLTYLSKKIRLNLKNFPQVFLGNQFLGKLVSLVETNGVGG